ncbi:MAG: HIT domain-containing protein [Planctomycetota bacterium]
MPTQPEKPNATPDALHAPWRMSYMELLASNERGPAPDTPDPGPNTCFLRRYWLTPEEDSANRVIVRTGNATTTTGGLVMLNAYPYSNGHLLVCLGESRMRLHDYTPEERRELWSLTDLAVELCERALGPQGVNVGLNQGEAAGAGVPEHLHIHVIPRWNGDVNFITTIGAVRVIPSAMDDMQRRYEEAWRAIRAERGLA